MAFAPLLAIPLLLASPKPASESRAYRTWSAGQEAGGAHQSLTRDAEGERFRSREWTRLERQGIAVQQEIVQTILRRPDGSLQFTFTLTLSQEPMEGRAAWSPATPGKLEVTFKGLPPRQVDLPAGAILWPGDEDAALQAAAKAGRAVHLTSFHVPTLLPVKLDLEPVGPEPLPGFPGTLRYRGRTAEGPLIADVEVWISPDQGDVRSSGSVGGLSLVTQRAELPPPAAGPDGPGFFERTLKTLPPHPFLPWLEQVTVRWTGKDAPNLPEDDQQRALGDRRYRLARPLPPSAEAQREQPVTGRPSAEDAPFLAETPLLRFRDPVFDGLARRLAAPAGASRWDLVRRVNAFVYDWIREVDYTVGFASAQEVARTPRGDCTEHGVLAVALLRRLGVPARGVTGWIALGEGMGLHFWAEAKVGGRWIPVDPTFDMAPASAFRIKLGTTDLADLGSVGWDNAAASFQEGLWAPDAPWAEAVTVQGDTVRAPGRSLRAAGHRFSYADGRLFLDGRCRVQAAPRPLPALDAKLLQGQGGRRGWFARGTLWADCGGDWLEVDALTEAEAFRLLDALEVRPR